MRILHLIHSEGTYGAERILMYLCREVRSLGHETVIGSIRDPGTPTTDFETAATSFGLEVVPIRIAPRPTPGVISDLLHTIRGIAPDVLHSHGYKANILLGGLPRRWRGPMLATVHGWTFPKRFTALWAYELLDRLCLRRLDLVVAVSRQMLDLAAIRSLGRERCRLIENGIPSLETRLTDQRRAGEIALPPELVAFVARAPTLVSIGRLSPEKGFDVLLDAFSAMRARHERYQLAIVGDGPLRSALLERVSRLGLANYVILPGYVQYADRLLEQAAGFVMSSLTEGMPLVLLEAMQWKVPIVATRVGSIPEILAEGRGGLVARPGDAGSLSEALEVLVTGDASERVTAAAEAVSSRYSSARMGEEYLRAYASVI